MPIEFDLEQSMRKAARIFGDDAASDAVERVLRRQMKLRFECQEKLDAYVMKVAKDFHIRQAEFGRRFVDRADHKEFLPTQEKATTQAIASEIVDLIEPSMREALVEFLTGAWGYRDVLERHGISERELWREVRRVKQVVKQGVGG